MSSQNKSFQYIYSAKQQKEVEAIRKKYITDIEITGVDYMEQLRKLDNDVTTKAMIPALTLGIIGTLTLGFGMSLVMTDLGIKLGIGAAMFIGILIGVIGSAGVIFAYPLYHHILEKERQKAAPQIWELVEKLL